MTWVKVCGLTREADVSNAVDAGADALGFVIAADSPRRVDLGRAKCLMDGLPVLRILVTADEDADAVLEAASRTGADGVQPHGDHSASVATAAAAAGLFVLRPVPVGRGGPLSSIDSDTPGIPLLDSANPDVLGGSGTTFDWSIIGHTESRFVLAGGLGPDNVSRAVRAVHPWGVDASSRLEISPGVKDPGRVADFIARAKGEG
jgi:phosphoribosylanthranilate isomerase